MTATAAEVCEPRVTLDDVLDYRNKDVVESFCEALDIPRDEADKIFLDTLKFLWLSEATRAARRELPKDGKMRTLCTVDEPLLIIDEMWHTFVLYTVEYGKFCEKYFGRFIHHQPTTVAEKRDREARKSTKEHCQKVLHKKRQRYTKLYDLLGRETFIRWFHDFPKQYAAERILALRKK